MKRREFHFFVAVWGKWHVETFLGMNLPTLLAPDNLPYLAGKMDVRYHVATSASDAERFEQSEAFSRLSATCQVELEVLPDSDFGNPVSTQMKLWHAAVSRATEHQAFLCPFPADMVWSNGSYRTVAELLLNGKKCIYAMFLRVVDETFSPEIARLRQTGSRSQELSVPPRELMKIILRNIHPLHAAYLRSGEHFPGHSEYVYWPVRDEGLLMRSTATTVLVFDTKDRKVDNHFSIDRFDDASEIGFIPDSDDMCGASVTPLKKDWSWYLEQRRLNIDDIGRWWLIFEGAVSAELSKTNFRFHVGECDNSKWRRVERAGDFTIQQSTAAREISRIVVELSRNQCRYAAKILATALLAGRLRRYWHWRPPFVVVVPVDQGFMPDYLGQLEKILRCDKEVDLNTFVLNHVCSVAQVADATTHATERSSFDVTMFGGRRARFVKTRRGLTINRSKVVGEVQPTDDVRILFVNRPIFEPTVDSSFTIVSAEESKKRDLPQFEAAERSGNDLTNILRYFFLLRGLARGAFSKAALSRIDADANLAAQSSLHEALFNSLVKRVLQHFIANVGQIATPSGGCSLLTASDVDQSVLYPNISASLQSWAAHIRGLIETLRGHRPDAMRWYKESIATFGENGRTWKNIGELQIASGQIAEARHSFTKAAAILPGDRTVHRRLGELIRSSNSWKAADEFFRAALLSAEIEYVPTLFRSKDQNWIALGPYRNFKIFANPERKLWAACLQRHDIDLANLEHATSSSRILLGFFVARATRWKIYQRLKPLFRSSTVAISLPFTATPQSATVFRLPAFVRSTVARLLKAAREKLLSNPQLWQFAIVTNDLEELEKILTKIDVFLTPD